MDCQNRLFCHLLRCRQSTMPPHRLLPPPCRLTKYSALTIQLLDGWNTRACLKNHSRHLHAPLCGIFGPNSLNAAHCAAFIWPKSPTKRNAHLAESIFQTRSSEVFSSLASAALFSERKRGSGGYRRCPWRPSHIPFQAEYIHAPNPAKP